MSNDGQNPGSTPGGDGGNPGGDAKWYSGFESPELRGFVETKGWKDPGAAVESYRQLEKTIGVPAERLLKLPDKADAPEWKEIRAKVGVGAPEKPEDYGIPVPEGIDPGYAGEVAAKALEL